ncbi:MAG: ArsC family reductase [Candidatus Thiodiazotropha lotti]|nr:ArsC family reductase [Candidatus Thiodiazotropha lotti]MCG8000640.1 ArsC family reductase [Candidatus Thiodiazotropha lotti]MCW4181682.1 ArsC family reductase [Candidatus Thiodiazotropha weberae]MCW4192411.1 ArsC family reductase [Candidatus Thiodiazotropha weberae]
MVKMYGIPNCDTIKKASRWLDDHGVAYEFHDYKKAGVDEAMLTAWTGQLGWESLLNKRSTTWRQLDEAAKADLDERQAIQIMLAHPSIIKRPLLDDGKQLHLGFKADQYAQLF